MAEECSYMNRDLYLAVTSNDVETFRHLITNNDRLLSQRTPMKDTVLHLAAKHGYLDMVKEICRYQCSSLFTQTAALFKTPLHIAAECGHTEVVGLIIELARKVGSSENEDGKPLAEKMIEATSHFPHSGSTALHCAVHNGHLGVVKELTQSYPNLVSRATDEGWSPLYLASWKGHLQIVKHILSVDVQRSESFHKGPNGRCSLHEAIIERYQDVSETLLQELPYYATWIDDGGSSPLHIAAEKGMLSVVLKLLELHPSIVYRTNNWGDSPLHRAAFGGHLMVFKEITHFCPDSWKMINNRGGNILHVAVVNNQLDVVEYILKTFQFDMLLNSGDCQGNTPLHLAVMNDCIWIVFLLLEDTRIIVRIKNGDQKTPFDIISSKMDWSIPFSQKAAIWLAIKKVGKYTDVEKHQYDISRADNAKKWTDTANTLLVVAALIATVSFAAIFTLPGGYESEGSEQGLAHYRKITLFWIFLLLDGFAMFSSLVAALLIMVVNWTDSLGLRSMVPWDFKMTSISFISMFTAFTLALRLMVRFNNWVLGVVSFLGAIIVCLVVCLLGFNSPAYYYWRVYLVFKRVKRMMTQCMHILTLLKFDELTASFS